VRLCLALGGVVLAGACGLGYALPAQRDWVLLLLACSVLLFAAALGQQWRGSVRPAAGTHTPPPAASAPSVSSPRPEPTRLAAPAATPKTALMVMPTPDIPTPATAAAPAPPPRASPPTAPPRYAPPAPAPPPLRASTAPDVAQLMQSPLADLLLAALCKDPDGARRIFTQAVLHAAAAPATAAPPPASGVSPAWPAQGSS
jgi:hypothetical protein